MSTRVCSGRFFKVRYFSRMGNPSVFFTTDRVIFRLAQKTETPFLHPLLPLFLPSSPHSERSVVEVMLKFIGKQS
ncbi:MAG: hypothetical protein HY644_13125 [Acidobacteria bacterium]|nr:hypothetical protein [Acidobacteriota bacterium]